MCNTLLIQENQHQRSPNDIRIHDYSGHNVGSKHPSINSIITCNNVPKHVVKINAAIKCGLLGIRSFQNWLLYSTKISKYDAFSSISKQCMYIL